MSEVTTGTLTYVDPWAGPRDYIINGFSLKDTILEVMLGYNLDIAESIAE